MSSTDDYRWTGLASLARALGATARVDEVLDVAADEILRALDADSVSISRLEPGTWTLRTLLNVGALGPNEHRKPAAELYQLEDFAHFAHVFRDQRIWISSVDDPDADIADVALLCSLRKGSSLTAPLVVNGVMWGELFASWFSPRGAVAAMHHGYLEALCAVLAGAIARALQTEALEDLAFRDSLTGLANRRALDLAAHEAFVPTQRRSHRRLSVVAADINGLKAVNDSAGHHRGDALIQTIAAQLQRHFKPLYGSLPARVGGDEFAVLVPGHPLAAVTAAGNNWCADARLLPGSSGVSCGVASVVLTSRPATVSELFAAADQAMYQAKQEDSLTVRVTDINGRARSAT